MIKAVALDLDDTLLNTSGLLAPKATSDAFSNLIKNGLRLTLHECEALRVELIKSISHRDVFEKLAVEYGDEKTRSSVAETTRLFYDPVLPDHLPLLEGARENIDYLKSKYHLYLVTAGTLEAQLTKARSLGVYDDFKKIFVVNSLIKQRKKDSFLEILKLHDLQPHELLCVGNSISSEITDAINIDAQACYFEFGENRGSLEDLPRKPHFHIHHHSELVKTCQL
jgi:putative hydrolase of the HAD superfamily